MAHPQDIVVVTTAGLSHTDDRKLRERRYFYTQLARISCFVLAVVLPVPLWAKLLLIVGAFTLPWFGVMAANAGPALPKRDERTAILEGALDEPVRIAIEPGRTIDAD